MLCTVREGKSRRVLEEGVGGAAERERESTASERRRKRRFSERCEPRLQPSRYRSREDRSVEDKNKGTHFLLLCQLQRVRKRGGVHTG